MGGGREGGKCYQEESLSQNKHMNVGILVYLHGTFSLPLSLSLPLTLGACSVVIPDVYVEISSLIM